MMFRTPILGVTAGRAKDGASSGLHHDWRAPFTPPSHIFDRRAERPRGLPQLDAKRKATAAFPSDSRPASAGTITSMSSSAGGSASSCTGALAGASPPGFFGHCMRRGLKFYARLKAADLADGGLSAARRTLGGCT